MLKKGILFLFLWMLSPDSGLTTQVFPSRGSSFMITHGDRLRRSPIEPEQREDCKEGAIPPNTHVNTTEQLHRIRLEMDSSSLAAYIIPMDDAHQSEYVADADKRVEFISGFSGSAGTVVVLSNGKAALWTDGRYFLQMEAELDCNWTLMKSGLSTTPSIAGWLKSELAAGDKVGADPTVMSYDSWTVMATSLQDSGLSLEEVTENLVDTVWHAMGGRPPMPNNTLLILDMKYAGKSWQDKVQQVREGMGSSANALVITALDESAWLFNLRGSDIVFNPVFFAYSIVEKDQVSLYLYDSLGKLTDELQNHLNTQSNGVCLDNSSCVNVKDYSSFWDDLGALAGRGQVWVSPMSSYAVYSKLGDTEEQRQEKAYIEPSLVRLFKGRKNPVEVEGMRKCHKRDAATLIEFLAKLEKGVMNGEEWTEITATDELERMRRDTDLNMGLSFDSISGVGPNGAIIHYRATKKTERPITTTEMYLLDSGGQYLDGTTDVTRTMHYGTPNDKEKEAYTRVLMGSIELAMAVWVNGTYGRDIDVLAREPQWKVGWQYLHGTGHGLGMFLNVHEGPGRINMGYREYAHESPLYGEMFFSDEPGFYEDGEFGVRLETIVMTTKVETKYHFGQEDFLGFEIFTLVPFEPHLIEYDLLTSPQRKWLNAYHERCLKEVGEAILRDERGNMEAYEWVKARTWAIPDDPHFSSASRLIAPALALLLMAILIIVP